MKVVCLRDPSHKLAIEGVVLLDVNEEFDFSNIYCTDCTLPNGDPNLSVLGTSDEDGEYVGDTLGLSFTTEELRASVVIEEAS